MHSLAEIRRPRTRRKLGPQRLDDLLGSQAMLGRKRDISRGASAAMGQVRAVPVLPGHQRATTRSYRVLALARFVPAVTGGLQEATTRCGNEAGTSARARAGTPGHGRHAAERRFAGET
jgi:hypothetical protein